MNHRSTTDRPDDLKEDVETNDPTKKVRSEDKERDLACCRKGVEADQREDKVHWWSEVDGESKTGRREMHFVSREDGKPLVRGE